MTYTTNTGRVLEAIIYDGTNDVEINSLPGFLSTEVVDNRLLITGVSGSFYASIGNYIVYNGSGFVEIMDASNFE
jgi:hypothetical protein